jgi:hypothetical protein
VCCACGRTSSTGGTGLIRAPWRFRFLLRRKLCESLGRVGIRSWPGGRVPSAPAFMCMCAGRHRSLPCRVLVGQWSAVFQSNTVKTFMTLSGRFGSAPFVAGRYDSGHTGRFGPWSSEMGLDVYSASYVPSYHHSTKDRPPAWSTWRSPISPRSQVIGPTLSTFPKSPSLCPRRELVG